MDINTSQFSNPSELEQFVILYDSEQNKVPLVYSGYSTGRNQVALQPASSLSAGEEYRIYVDNGIYDSNNLRPSIENYSWTFTTTGLGLSAPTLQEPSNATVKYSFPDFVWSDSASALGYQLQISEQPSFSEVLYSTLTNESSASPLSDSFSDNKTYYWRVRAYSLTATGDWSTSWSFFYGDRQTAHSSSRTSWRPDSFDIESSSLEETLSNISDWPTISITFTNTPASSFSNYLTITSQSVVARTDIASSVLEHTVSGSWALSGNSLLFTPSAAIEPNTEYKVTATKGMVSTDGAVLPSNYVFFFVSNYTPFYANTRLVEVLLREEANYVTKDLIDFHIHLASLELQARYAAFRMSDASLLSGFLTEDTVRSQTPNSHPVPRWVAAKAAYELMSGLLLSTLRKIGRTVQVADFTERYTKDFLDAIKMAKDSLKEELDKWEDTLFGGSGSPTWGTTSENWSPWYWDNTDKFVRSIENPNMRGRF